MNSISCDFFSSVSFHKVIGEGKVLFDAVLKSFGGSYQSLSPSSDEEEKARALYVLQATSQLKAGVGSYFSNYSRLDKSLLGFEGLITTNSSATALVHRAEVHLESKSRDCAVVSAMSNNHTGMDVYVSAYEGCVTEYNW